MDVESYNFTDEKGSRGYNWDELYPQLLALDRDQFRFAIQRPQGDGSFSADAIESLARATMSFVLARCMAYWKEHGEPARQLVIDVDLTLTRELSPRG